MYTIATRIKKYKRSSAIYVRMYIICTCKWLTRGENVLGIQCLPAQMFYCIIKQPLNPQYHTHATVRTTPLSLWCLCIKLAKHRTVTDTQTEHIVDHVWSFLTLLWWWFKDKLLQSLCDMLSGQGLQVCLLFHSIVCVNRCGYKWVKWTVQYTGQYSLIVQEIAECELLSHNSNICSVHAHIQ